MAADPIAWPKKTREIVSCHLDSTRWNDFKFRDDDIVIATWAKSGTTWTQQIVSQVVIGPHAPFAGGPPNQTPSPWLDARPSPRELVREQLEAQTHRRFIKTHLPIDALVFLPNAKYIHVGRDTRDIVWSLYNHEAAYTDGLLSIFNDPPGLPGYPITRPSCDVRDYYFQFLEASDADFKFNGAVSFWNYVQGWWNARRLPNVLLVHFANLKSDLPREMRRIANFLCVNVHDADWPHIAEHCSFDYMKRMAAQMPGFEMAFQGGGSTFINKGTNGRWKEVLSPQEIAKCDEVAAKHLAPDCMHWLRTGELPIGEDA